MNKEGNTTKEQRMEALGRANKVRCEGAQLRREIREGEIGFKEVLGDDRAGPMRLSYLLLSQRRWGLKRMHKLLRRLDLNGTTENRRARDLTKRERDLIVYALRHPEFWVTKDGQLVPEE